ncbi:S9 family peptidase [Streptacidiphilus anmyonensis]|uniref:S9 family peptidase n=1 Tax=Streptacidiphilus anmyonensis TaxID=405782 RepID=UPI0006943926|nr:S9 family peptidase [Streptacidiphilus anmyonensis]
MTGTVGPDKGTSARHDGGAASPITPEAVGDQPGAPSWPAIVGPETWWCAPDPASASVRLLRCATPGAPVLEVLDPAWSVGNRSIGYGGRPYAVLPGTGRHRLVFTHAADQRLYAADVAPLHPATDASAPAPALAPVPLTPADPDGVRTAYADPIPGPDATEIWCVRETTRTAPGDEAADPAPRTRRDVVAVPLSGAGADDPRAVRVVARSHHFLSGIRLSPDGARLAWTGWDHPDMPWDSSELMVARIRDGVAVEPARVLGGDGVSVPQAEWADADTLYAMADPDGWWNLHRVDLVGDGAKTACVLRADAEDSHALWRVGATSFAVTDAGVVLRRSRGAQTLHLWDPATGELRDAPALTALAGEWTDFAVGLSGDAKAVAVVAAGPAETATPLRIDLAPRHPGDAPTPAVARCAVTSADRSDGRLSVPQHRAAAVPGGWLVPFAYYPPTAPYPTDASPAAPYPTDASRGAHAVQAPPLLIDVHGGPTSRTGGTRSVELSLFTSRGFAVASVDYGGSTGYGRAYRDRLRHQWGTVDVDDCVAVARTLAEAGLADPARTAIRGGSAGGWTALAALAHTDVFCCGAVYYPISDPLTWSGGQTHDFESRYIETLVGALPDDEERLRAVSPLANAAAIDVPFVMLQGLDDTICRPDQARCLVEAVDAAHGPGLCFRFLQFPGEGHGFRRSASVAASLRAELDLYAHVMGAP